MMKYTYDTLYNKNIWKFKKDNQVKIGNAMSFLDLNCCDKCGLIQHTWNDLYWDCDFDFGGKYSALCGGCFDSPLYPSITD